MQTYKELTWISWYMVLKVLEPEGRGGANVQPHVSQPLVVAKTTVFFFSDK